MIKRVVFFILGILVGIAFDMVPHAIEVMANTEVCRESCSDLLKGISLAAYAALPIAWGALFATVIGKPHAKRILLSSALLSLVLMVLLTWFLYKHQHP